MPSSESTAIRFLRTWTAPNSTPKVCLALLAGLLSVALSPAVAQTKPYEYFRVGSPTDVQRQTQGGFALIGGGKDLDPAFLWMCERSGGGDFLVLRATGTDAYNGYVNGLCHENSVATLVIPSRQAANDPFVEKTISNAEAVFISGGDQANYINFWTGTAVQKALNDAIHHHVPIGGTSAGLAVQGEYIYSAQHDPPEGPDLTSKLALADPFQNQVVVVRGFLDNPLLARTITDTHFVKRDRIGRLLVFMARAMASNSLAELKAIGVDEQTAVLLDPSGRGEIVGHDAVYAFDAKHAAPTLSVGVPLVFSDVAVQKCAPGEHLDFRSWKGCDVSYTLDVEHGVIHSAQAGGQIY